MSKPTIEAAMLVADASAEKTLLVTAFNNLLTALQTSNDHGRFSGKVAAELNDETCALAERYASNLI